MNNLQYITGDAANPSPLLGRIIIAHIVNDLGVWGRGFVMSLSKRWKNPEIQYKKWHTESINDSSLEADKQFQLGNIQVAQVSFNMWVCNMLAQEGLIGASNPKPVQYEKLEKCLEKLRDVANQYKAVICMPRIGAGLGGGDWRVIEAIILNVFESTDIQIYIYDLPK